MTKKLILIIFATSFLISQSIIHNPINNIQEGGSLEIEASMVGVSPLDRLAFTIFFKTSNQRSYVYADMKYQNGVYKFIIPNSFINNNPIEYYIVSEIDGKGFYAYPEVDPEENPILVKPDKSNNFSSSSFLAEDSGLLKPNYQILSPEQNSNILFEDLLISLSYFKMEDIDPDYTKIYVNDIDYTQDATIKLSHFSIIPIEEWPAGEYDIRVQFRSVSGLDYEPILWSFSIISEKTIEKQDFIISQGGSIVGDYNTSYNDGNNLNVGELSGNYNLNLDWLQFKSNLLFSSLENEQEQTKNRLSFNFKTKYYDFKFGDSYPNFSEYSIKGARLRGNNIIFQNNFLYLNILTGSLLRATQGLPDEAIGLIVNSSSYINETNFSDITPGVIDITRNGYTFEQGIFGVNLEIAPTEKFKWGLELLKVKDRTMSVDINVDNSIVLLPEEMVRHLYSDIYMIDEMGEKFLCNYDDHDIVKNQAFDGDDNFSLFDPIDDLDDFSTKSDWVSYNQTTVDLGEYNEECSGGGIGNNKTLFQDQWIIYIKYDDLQTVIDDFKNNSKDSQYYQNSYYFGDYVYNILSDDWDGNKPNDNIVIATDFLHTIDNGKLKINYGLGFTMLNQNMWEPTLNRANLDSLGASSEQEKTDNKFYGTEIPEGIDNLEKYEDIFQTGISQVPIIPIDIEDGIKFEDFLTLPSAAIFFDVSHKYFGHRINWGFRQIGPEYNTLGNPYLQTNIREQYFSDRTYLLDNKLNVLFKWKRTEDGISLTEDNGETNKYDLNLGFYPGANMPIYNIGIGIYNRDNGIDPLTEEVPVLDVNQNGIVDSVQCTESNISDFPDIELTCNDLTSDDFYYEEILSTQLYQPERNRTSQYSLSVTSPFEYIFKHNISFNIFFSEKKDLIEGIVNKTIDKYIEQDNNDYYSSSSRNESYNINIRTTYTKRLESSFGLNYTYYSYGYEDHAYHPEYFQQQKIYMMDLRLFYDTLSWIGKIDPGINLSIGDGTSNNFNQITFKIGSIMKVVENLDFSINLNSKFKFIKNDNDNMDFSNDYSGFLQLRYRF
tara:strand:+ start:2807 stop:5968 length:3162 start_codon:yes stop_codon:yes gene_type:complete